MKQVNFPKMLNDLIAKERVKVIGVMYVSNVDPNGVAYNDLTDKQIYDLIMAELEKGNDELMVNLGSLIDQEFDLSALNETKSNLSGDPQPPTKSFGDTKVGGFLADNKGAIIGGGLDILKNFFNKGSGGSTTAPTPTGGGGGGGNSDLAAMLAAQAAEADRKRDEDAAKSSRTWMIVGVVGGLLVLGTIVTIIIVKSGKK